MDRLRCFIVFVCAVWDGEYFDELIDFYFFLKLSMADMEFSLSLVCVRKGLIFSMGMGVLWYG